MQNQIRINKFIAESGVCSRRAADKLIEQGKVKINGVTAECGSVINPETDKVEVEGKGITQEEKKVYFMLNKPEKVLTAAKDERGRKTVLDIVRENERVFPIGRLDFETEGLLILTNDGELYNRIIHPKAEVYKKYIAVISGRLTNDEKSRLINGINLEDGKTLPARVRIVGEEKGNNIVEISIREGRNRQVRRMFKACGHLVLKLKRVAIGNLELQSLKVGQYRELSKDEVKYLYSL